MPLYEYRCTGCRRPFEALLDRWNSPTPPCPHCGAERAERQLSVFAVAAPATGGCAAGDAPGVCGPGGCGCCSSPN